MSSDIRNTIHEFVTRECLQDRPDFVLADHTNLLKEHVIDSLEIFMLSTFLEEKYGIVIEAEDVVIENFETLVAVSNLVEAKLEASAATRSA
jgi:acyl carrier protein